MRVVDKLTQMICTYTLILSASTRLINENVRYETDCGNETPLVTCERNYCSEATCDAHPSAECRLSLCDICKPVFYAGGVEVDCRKKRKNNFARTECGAVAPWCSDLCTRRRCKAYPNAECRVSQCGYCKVTFYVKNVVVDCDANDISIPRSVVVRRQLSPCEREKRRGHLRKKANRFVVNCTTDGAYQSLQCWPAVGLCWCLNKHGKELLGSRTYFPLKPNCDKIVLNCRSTEFGCCPDNITPAKGLHQEGCPGVNYKSCEKTLYGCCSDGKTISRGANYEGCPREPTKCELQNVQADPAVQFQPRCEPDGSFLRIQCLPYTGLCWCVDSDGQELEGTRTSGRPDCSRAICEDKREDCLLYARVSGFCAKISHYMKVYCRKSCGFCKDDSNGRLSGFLGPTRPGCSSDYGCCEDLVTPAKGRNDYLCPLYTSPCHMPKITGRCEGAFERFYYDPLSNRCESFVYGGCHGNENNFKKMLDCEDECLVETIAPDQLLLLGEKDKLASSNTETARKLSGIIIPANGYNSSCNSAFGCCKDGVTPATGPWKLDCPRYNSHCHMPAATGPCNKYLTRYFYNTKTKNCDAFVYGGCDGNANRFVTREDCRQECVNEKESGNEVVAQTKKKSDTGNSIENRIRAIITETKKVHQNQVVKKLRKIINRVKNRRVKQSESTKKSRKRYFKKLSECEKREYVNKVVNNLVISQPHEKVYQPNCSFDGTFSKLQCWKDQGYCWCVDADGNEIEATKSSRMPACPSTLKPKKSCVDRSPRKCADYGNPTYCKRYKVFMKRACPQTCGYCKEPVARPGCRSKYGCCDDGVTAKRRDSSSCPVYRDECEMPKNSGRCLGYMERFYYDASIKQCVEFIYGGCDGNKNNFLTRKECEYRCNFTLFSNTLKKIERDVEETTTKEPVYETTAASTTTTSTETTTVSTSHSTSTLLVKTTRATTEEKTDTKNERKTIATKANPTPTTTESATKPVTKLQTPSSKNKTSKEINVPVSEPRGTPPTSSYFTSTEYTTTEEYSTTEIVDEMDLSTVADNIDNTIGGVITPTPSVTPIVTPKPTPGETDKPTPRETAKPTPRETAKPTPGDHIADKKLSTVADKKIIQTVTPTVETDVDNNVESFFEKRTFEPTTEGPFYSTLSTPFEHGFDYLTNDPDDDIIDTTSETDQPEVVTVPSLSVVSSTQRTNTQRTIASTKLNKYTDNTNPSTKSASGYTRSKSVGDEKDTKKHVNTTFTITPGASKITISPELVKNYSAPNESISSSRETDQKDTNRNITVSTTNPATKEIVESTSTRRPYVTITKKMINKEMKNETMVINNKVNNNNSVSVASTGSEEKTSISNSSLNKGVEQKVITASNLSDTTTDVSNVNNTPMKKKTDTVTTDSTTKSISLPLSSTRGPPITVSTTKVDDASAVAKPTTKQEFVSTQKRSTMLTESSPTKIPTVTVSTSLVDNDFVTTDLPPSTISQDTSSDTTPDTGLDKSSDTISDTISDTSTETTDTSSDTSTDTNTSTNTSSDSSTNTSSDSSTETSSDTSSDTTSDTSSDTSSDNLPYMSTQPPQGISTTPEATESPNIIVNTLPDSVTSDTSITTDSGISDTSIATDTDNPLNIGDFFTDSSNLSIDEVKTSATKTTMKTTLKTDTPMTSSSKVATTEQDGLDATCTLKAERGICNDNLPRYHYNAVMKRCILFSYSGCEGNGNNFRTMNECITKCTVADEKPYTRGTVTPNVLGCNSIYGCCPDRVNPAKGAQAKGCPVYKSVCEMPPHKGPCQASITRWHYDKRAETCKSFTYGGCDGNENNFLSDVDCYITCDAQYTDPTNIKSNVEEELEVVMYPGCTQSSYGCCSDGVSIPAGPNQDGCPIYNSVCDMPNVVGTCDNRLARFYFDTKTKKCTNFMFSGCGGNMNNFDSMAECNVKCHKRSTSCKDAYYLCKPWKDRGFCESSPDISGVYCKLTCDKCDDKF